MVKGEEAKCGEVRVRAVATSQSLAASRSEGRQAKRRCAGGCVGTRGTAAGMEPGERETRQQAQERECFAMYKLGQQQQ